MKKLTTFLFLLLAFVVFSCGEKKQIVEIKELATYDDPIMGFSIKYPTNWEIQKYPGDRFLAFTTKTVIKRFRTFDPEGEAGAKIELLAIKLPEGQTIDSVIAKKQFTPETYSAPTKVVIDGVEAVKQTYEFPLGDGVFHGEIYYAQKDPQVVTVISFEAFGSTFENYKAGFDQILNSVKLAYIPQVAPDTVKKVVEAPPPSSNLIEYKGEGFSIKIPDNFDVRNPKVGGALKSYQYIGERRLDCDIRIDIFDASKQNKLDKIVEDNKARHKNTEPKPTTLSGEKAYYFEYSPIQNVKSRVYYVVHNNKLYRITMNWFVGEEQNYKPIFEKSVNSFKFQ
ncbi:hypothetical protein D9V84_06155 [Bacteroidetes/Chlorobi group bacterium Naka2016]|jgi:hypothetical protein|nr:MAG: hypothetical protein D9V84_06155 [Bacteroidetes/Chlorobi group bacterium Naka2016]